MWVDRRSSTALHQDSSENSLRSEHPQASVYTINAGHEFTHFGS